MTNKKLIIGAITGDIIGSVFEWDNIKTINFDLFRTRSTYTDDSVLTLATMSALINNTNYGQTYHSFGREFSDRGYGPNFVLWLRSDNPKPYNSWGNGSAMRVSPIGWFFNNIDDTLFEAKKSAEVTHNHPEGIKGAQAVASAIFLARNGGSKDEIKKFIIEKFGYNLDRTIDDIRPNYEFDVSCQGSVPEAIIAFLESSDFESAIRLAVSIGGDSDTIACITGGIAEVFYRDIPDEITDNVLRILPGELTSIIEDFSKKCG